MSEEQYFKGDDLALSAWTTKYRHGSESLDEFFIRIASEFARLDNFKKAKELSGTRFDALSDYGKKRVKEDRYEKFLKLFKDFKHIIPGGSVLAGIGSGKPISLSNCFVVSTDDSIESIFDAATNMSQIYKRRGGVGVDLSPLRPNGAVVNNAAKITSGVVPFMELYSQVTNTIGQDGRRGALMLSIDIKHPDSPEFITIKQDLTKVTGANVSVKVDTEFKNAVKADKDFVLRWPCDMDISNIDTESLPYNELKEISIAGEVESVGYLRKIKAKELWDTVIHCAWKSAEPGILFWDNIISMDPASVYPRYKAVSTNPCGEIPLSPYDSCRLIATNVFGMVKYPFSVNAFIDTDEAYEIFYEAQIIGDILVDLEIEAVKRLVAHTSGREQELWTQVLKIGEDGRRTGVGITGLADMLAAIATNYANIDVIDKLMSIKMKAELDATVDLAIINHSFNDYDPTKEYGPDNVGLNKFYEVLKESYPEEVSRMQTWGRRNISWSTINGGLTQ